MKASIGPTLEEAEAELRLTSERLLIVQRVAKLGFWDWNIRTGDLYWSDEIYPMFGLAKVEFGATYDAFIQAVHSDDRDFVRQSVEAAVNGGVEYNIEHRLIRPDGTVVDVNERGEVVRNAAGDAVRMLGTVLNITDMKNAERVRQEREAEFQGLWESSFNAMFTVNSDGGITLASPSAERMFGYTSEELIGRPIEHLIPNHLRDVHIRHREEYQVNPYARAMGSGLELEALHRSGDRILVEISLTPIMMRGNREVLVEVQDVSTRRALENRLRQSEKLKALGQLTGGIAHDLNNILTVVLGFTELSQKKLDPKHESYAYLKDVKKAGERAKIMVSQMLAFTRQQVLQPQLLNISTAIRDIEEMLKRLTPAGVELILNLDADLGRVHVDPTQLERVVVNLVVNGSDAMPGGGKLIVATHNIELDEDCIRTRELAHPGSYVELSVSDTGRGILPDVLENIFDPFFTTKEQGKGTGLGLATVYGIVKQSNGEVLVYSEPGKGTSFRVFLPITEARNFSREPAREDLASTPGCATILLVENDDGVRDLTKRILETKGYIVHAFPSGERALTVIQGSIDIDLVLTDIVLDGMNGVDFGEVLKKTHPTVPVLFMSGYAGRALESMDFVENNTNFLSKPFTQKSLLQGVAQVLLAGQP